MATTQFDGIYYGLSPEVGSEYCSPIGSSGVHDAAPLLLCRIPNSAERDGLEGRRERGDQVDTFC